MRRGGRRNQGLRRVKENKNLKQYKKPPPVCPFIPWGVRPMFWLLWWWWNTAARSAAIQQCLGGYAQFPSEGTLLLCLAEGQWCKVQSAKWKQPQWTLAFIRWLLQSKQKQWMCVHTCRCGYWQSKFWACLQCNKMKHPDRLAKAVFSFVTRPFLVCLTIPFFKHCWSKSSTSSAKFDWFGLVIVYSIWTL